MGQEGQEIPQEPAAEPSAVPRARGCLKGSKTGASQKPLTSTDTLIKSRCAVDSAMKFYHEKVHDRLTDEHINLLASTPFLHLFCFPKEFHLSSAVLHNILTFYDENQGVFTFKTKKFKFVPEEVSLFMGLPFDGPPVQFDRSILTDSTIRSTYFPPGAALSRHDIEEKIIECLDRRVPTEHVVSLLIMYIFTMILFPQAGVNVPVKMFYYVDDNSKLKKYSWGKACFETLSDHIPSASK